MRWGATAKVAAIDAAHPALLKRQAHATATDTLDTTSTTGGVAVDLVTVMKAAQTISGEIVLDRLLEAVMRSVLESAGAQRGMLIVERNAAKAGLFTADPYVVGCQARSILCAPLINQGKLTAILYLENNLTVGAFTEDRLEVLRILSAQAALSIHNARLYGNLGGARAARRVPPHARAQGRGAHRRAAREERRARDHAHAAHHAAAGIRPPQPPPRPILSRAPSAASAAIAAPLGAQPSSGRGIATLRHPHEHKSGQG